MLVITPLISQSEILRFEDLVIQGNPVALEGAIELLTQVLELLKLHISGTID
jgi:hypothetical protein